MMESWILYLAGAQILCFVVSLFLEGTKYAKVASKVCGIFLAFCLCFPLFSAQSGEINWELGEGNDFLTNTEYITNVNTYKINLIKSEVESVLQEYEISTGEVIIRTSGSGEFLVVENILINLSEAEYRENEKNIDEIKKSVSEVIRIGTESIDVNS